MTHSRNIETIHWHMRSRQVKRFLSYTAIAGLILQNAGSLWASGPGTTAADVLKIGVGARAIGMGEAYTAQADDVSSLY